MVLKHFFTAVFCTTLLAWSGPSIADPYQPGDFLTLDLSKAVLSPKLLGPVTQFGQFPVEAASDSNGPAWQSQARAPPRQSARRAGLRYADSGLAMQVGRHLQLVAAEAGAITQPCQPEVLPTKC
jgi:hypothetical protein